MPGIVRNAGDLDAIAFFSQVRNTQLNRTVKLQGLEPALRGEVALIKITLVSRKKCMSQKTRILLRVFSTQDRFQSSATLPLDGARQ
jgi:hypothetical protein